MTGEIFAKGKRGIIHLAQYKGKTIVVKSKNPKSTAIARIEIEAQFLKKLNKFSIGPKFHFFKDQKLGMEFIEGVLFEEYIQKNSKKNIQAVITDLFTQLFQLDKLKINKEEMHHPVKHIIVRNHIPVLIDFERCHYTEKPKNITQFVQYLSKDRIIELLNDKFIKLSAIQPLARVYKSDPTKRNLQKILKKIS